MSGRRNEQARARRRTQIKNALSLVSVPKSEQDYAGTLDTSHLTLKNHFGWAVLQKSQLGDGTFPHLFQYYEKPDLHGRDFDKVTYVLYMDKGTIVDKKTSLKETQTAISGVLVAEKPPSLGDYYKNPRFEQSPPMKTRTSIEPEKEVIPKPDRRKKNKLISEFYYNRPDRSRSRSSGDRNKVGYHAGDLEWRNPTPDVSQTYLSQIHHKAPELEKKVNDRIDLVKKEIMHEKQEAAGRATRRYNDGKFRFRAGAEEIEREYKDLKEKYEKTPQVMKQKHSNLMEFVRCKSDKYETAEELLKTSSGTNHYLYVSGKKRQR